ncbi:hypothetical protein GCM10009416_41760 [Craurococcus roseus]|uniref:Uncharacterized protein n=1 Tax=Craurococcus roseus TaxID=77585 RepID=A0ABN1FWL5_9PROT
MLVVALVGLVVARHVMDALAAGGFFATGLLVDSDSWTRVQRVLDLRQGAGWFDETVLRLDAPSGLSLHWTRLLDVMILLPALALESALGLAPRDAVLLAGAWVCPVLHGACVAAAVHAARALWTGTGPVLAGLLVAGNPVVGGYSGFGRADHHTLILLAELLALGAAVRAAAWPADARGAAWRAGAFGGLGVWVSPEALLVAAPVLAGFGVLWVAEGARGLPPGGAAAQGLRASLGFTLAVAAGVLCEHPPSGWLGGEYDKVSAQHVLIGALAAAVFGAARRVAGGPARRAAMGGAAAAVAAGVLLLLRPHALNASLASVDHGAARFISMVSEMRPVDLSPVSGLLGDAPVALAATPAALLVLALAAPGWRREGRLAAAVPLGLALAATLPATLLHRRFALDLAAPACLLAAGLPVLALGLRRPELRPAMALLGMAVAFGTPLLALLGAAVAPARDASQSVAFREECGATALAATGRRDRSTVAPGSADPVLLANTINTGPELAWRTPFRLVGAPYHRGGGAITDTFAFFDATDDAAARAIAERRRASLVLLCAPWPNEEAAAASLLWRLRRGEAPEWMAPVDLPGAPAGVRLFEVRPPRPDAAGTQAPSPGG